MRCLAVIYITYPVEILLLHSTTGSWVGENKSKRSCAGQNLWLLPPSGAEVKIDPGLRRQGSVVYRGGDAAPPAATEVIGGALVGLHVILITPEDSRRTSSSRDNEMNNDNIWAVGQAGLAGLASADSSCPMAAETSVPRPALERARTALWTCNRIPE